MTQELPEGTVTILFTDAIGKHRQIGMPKHVDLAEQMLGEASLS